VKKYMEVGGQRLVCTMQHADLRHDDLMRSIELFGTKIIPEIRVYEQELAQAAAAGGREAGDHDAKR
jgi:hypothetical protein